MSIYYIEVDQENSHAIHLYSLKNSISTTPSGIDASQIKLNTELKTDKQKEEQC